MGSSKSRPALSAARRTLETFDFVPDPTTHKIVLSVSDRPSAFERPGFWDDPRVFPRLLAVLVLVALSGGADRDSAGIWCR